MISILAGAVAVTFAQTTPLSGSDGENANRIRASIYETVQSNRSMSRFDPAIIGETHAQAPVPIRRPRQRR